MIECTRMINFSLDKLTAKSLTYSLSWYNNLLKGGLRGRLFD